MSYLHLKYAITALLLGLLSLAASANPQLASERHVVEPQRNRDYACTQCHQADTSAMQGEHAKVPNPNNGLAITCTNCHGNISAEHRNGAADAMRFGQESVFRAEQQNSVCLSCHKPDKLREAFWPHDVHVMKLSCASCHTLHSDVDPMQNLDNKQQVKLCVDCHSQQHEKRVLP